MGTMKTALLSVEYYRVLKISEAPQRRFQVRPIAVKPLKDTRAPTGMIMSRINGLCFRADVEVQTAEEIIPLLPHDVSIVFIDEAQFFGQQIVPVVESLINDGIDVVVAGLDMDFRKKPFPGMGELACMANDSPKLTTNCEFCGEEAIYTLRLIDGKPVSRQSPVFVVEGSGVETYHAVCPGCHKLAD